MIDDTDADASTCGLCIIAFSNLDDPFGDEIFFMPVAHYSSITFNELEMGAGIAGSSFEGSFQGLMQQVTIDAVNRVTTPIEGGCVWYFDYEFDEIVQGY